MADEKELIRKRGSYKGQLTTFNTFVDSLKVSSLTAAEANQLQLRIGRMESMYQQYDEVQLKIECTTDNLDSQIKERADFESIYFTTLSNAQQKLTCFNNSKKRDEFESCSERDSHCTNNRKLVKLPTIQLPKFCGSYENWLEFHDTFTSLIHSNDDIDQVNKFHYLRASLDGSAALVIKSIEFSANNYNVAWKLLCERFNNKRLLLQNHVSALFNIEPITKESSSQLKRVIDQINKNLRSLESLGEPVNQWDTLLIHIITHKLDTITFREWEVLRGSFDKNTPITFESFLSFMRNRADLIETLELSSASVAGHTSQPPKHTHKHRTMIVTQQTKTSRPTPCPICNGEHNLSGCSQFLALSNVERLQLLPNYKLCYNCFRSGHYANHCKKAGCDICKRKHNSLIHIAESQRKPCVDEGMSVHTAGCAATAAPAPFPAAGCNSPVTLSARVAGAHTSKGQGVLLPTALIKVYDNKNREHIARAVLDSGSTSCIISEKLCKRLHLRTDRINKSVAGINNTLSHVGKMCRVSMKSLNEMYTTTLNCFILPFITSDLPNHQHDLSNLIIPSDLCLADPNFHTPAAVDVIIGADLFWDLLGSQKIILGNGQPILCETKLGWLVSGPINSSHESAPSRTIKRNFMTVSGSKCSEAINDGSDDCFQPSTDFSNKKMYQGHYAVTTTRRNNGRSCVRLPLKENHNVISNSIAGCERRRINRSPDFKTDRLHNTIPFTGCHLSDNPYILLNQDVLTSN